MGRFCSECGRENVLVWAHTSGAGVHVEVNAQAARIKKLELALDGRKFKGSLSPDDFKGRRGMFGCQMLSDWCVAYRATQGRLPHSSVASECLSEPGEYVAHRSWSGSATLELVGVCGDRGLVYLPSGNGAVLGGEVVVERCEGKKVWFVGKGPLLVDGKELS